MTTSSYSITSPLSLRGYITEELGQNAEQYTLELRDAAKKAGWPVVAHAQLKIEVDSEGAYMFDCPASIKELVSILEYGDSANGPSPVIQNFMRYLEDKA